MKTLMIVLLAVCSVALLLGIAGVFGSEFILLSTLIALAIGVIYIPSALGLIKKEDDSYYTSEH